MGLAGAFIAGLHGRSLNHGWLLAVLVEIPFLEDYLGLRHDHSWLSFELQMHHHSLLVIPEMLPQLCVRAFIDICELQSELLALLEELVLVHVSGENVKWVTLAVEVRTLVIQAIGAFQEEAAVLCAPERRMEQPAIKDVLINR